MSERLVKRVNVVGRGSLSVIIPKRWAEVLGLRPGDRVSMVFDGSKVVITPYGGEGAAEDVNIMVEVDREEVALRKLVASYFEGVTRVRVRSGYEELVKLSERLREVVPSFLLMGNPQSTVHEVVFTDVEARLPELLRNFEPVVYRALEEIEEVGYPGPMYREFMRKYLHLLRVIKSSAAQGSLDTYEAVDLALALEYVKELIDSVARLGRARVEVDEALGQVLESARALIGAILAEDVESATAVADKVLRALDGIHCSTEACSSLKYLATRMSEIVLGRCIRSKACRCKYFFPKV
jgi:bifunctional DNA-binding transcriptional regulator/antitoxin component of YhaV-PrlF toxin-antitoxin module